jgi:hypothetical protein
MPEVQCHDERGGRGDADDHEARAPAPPPGVRDLSEDERAGEEERRPIHQPPEREAPNEARASVWWSVPPQSEPATQRQHDPEEADGLVVDHPAKVRAHGERREGEPSQPGGPPGHEVLKNPH